MKMLVSIEIAAAAEKIWPFLVEPEKIRKWAFTVKKIHFTSEQISGPNTTFYFEERAASPLITLNLVVTEWVLDERISFRMISSNLVKDYEQKYTIETIPSGSRFTCYENVKLPYGVIGKILGPFRQPVSENYLKRSFKKLKNLVEAEESTE
jgi:uncharacterized protein YndB with AHSA1/START domain